MGLIEQRAEWDAMTDDERWSMHMTVREDRARQKLAADRLEHANEQLRGAVEERDALLLFVRNYARWQTTADLNRLDAQARGLLAAFGGSSRMGVIEPSMPGVVGLCPVHLHDFYAPHGGACPQCQRAMVEYVPRAATEPGGRRGE